MDALSGEQPETVASADGTPIAVWRSGNGPPLVLVHGTAADHSRWAPVLPALAARFTVLAVDRRGRGASGDARDYALEREAEDVAAVIARAGDDVSVLGHSYGAGCAVEAARLAGGLRRLILYEPPLGYVIAPAGLVDRLEALLAAGERDELVAAFMQQVAGVPPEQIELMRSLPAWQSRMAAAHTIAREQRVTDGYRFEAARFADVDVPTLLLLGGESSDAFRRAAEVLHAALPESRLVELPGQRHIAMDTATDLFTTEVLGFLAA